MRYVLRHRLAFLFALIAASMLSYVLVGGLSAPVGAQQPQPIKQRVDRALTATQRANLGKEEYEATCAVCHGLTGKGDGIYVKQLKEGAAVPNLTELSKNNASVFPSTRLYEIIDGRQYVKAHGPREMPIWGTEYKVRSSHVISTLNSEKFVRARILALIDYIHSLQVK